VSCGLRLSGPEEAILAVKKGLPVSSFERLQKNLDVSTGVLASITHIAPRTLARRRKEGTLEASESQRVLRIGLLLDRATMVLGGVERARQWLKSPTKALGEKTPLEYADTEPGAKEVENLLGRIEHGVFS
jgi:putative toxin-antitoxin system antitoxin component (TIGR02293 family)